MFSLGAVIFEILTGLSFKHIFWDFQNALTKSGFPELKIKVRERRENVNTLVESMVGTGLLTKEFGCLVSACLHPVM